MLKCSIPLFNLPLNPLKGTSCIYQNFRQLQKKAPSAVWGIKTRHSIVFIAKNGYDARFNVLKLGKMRQFDNVIIQQ